MAEEILVLVTCPAVESEKLSYTLINEHLAACVNIVEQVKSIYIWEGKVCNETEHLLVIKSNRSVWDLLQSRVQQLHPYQVPEILSIDVTAGHKPYLDWLNAAVQTK